MRYDELSQTAKRRALGAFAITVYTKVKHLHRGVAEGI